MLKDITEIDRKIIGLYIPNYSASYSIRQMTSILKINYSYAFKRVKKLVKGGALIGSRVGASNSISLNIKSDDGFRLISSVEEMQEINNSTLQLMMQEARTTDPMCCMGLFGSRASGKAAAGSDWDVFIITRKEKKQDMGRIMGKFPHANGIHLLVFGIEEFKGGMLSIEENVVKHIIHNKQILYNPAPFYSLILLWEKMKYAPAQ
ncbi:MAG: nucleotidyltransferase domain-containing protein [Nanoarchaeota archaeon]|nr:nucleotidyltransferase domain-containing protein [Nanoarchaeota archaeon]